jgi:hypothetical protein
LIEGLVPTDVVDTACADLREMFPTAEAAANSTGGRGGPLAIVIR